MDSKNGGNSSDSTTNASKQDSSSNRLRISLSPQGKFSSNVLNKAMRNIEHVNLENPKKTFRQDSTEEEKRRMSVATSGGDRYRSSKVEEVRVPKMNSVFVHESNDEVLNETNLESNISDDIINNDVKSVVDDIGILDIALPITEDTPLEIISEILPIVQAVKEVPKNSTFVTKKKGKPTWQVSNTNTFTSDASKASKGKTSGKGTAVANKRKNIRKTYVAEVKNTPIVDDINNVEEYETLYGSYIRVRSARNTGQFVAKKKLRTSTENGSKQSTQNTSSERIVFVSGNNISVKEISQQMGLRVNSVLKSLMSLGVMANINYALPLDVAELLAEEYQYKLKKLESVAESKAKELLGLFDGSKKGSLLPRPPVVTIMGHVDHGKTSLLDAIRNSNVATKESGGITQHIGAYSVTDANGRSICFLDTPGHVAFSEMRSRGAKVTDIAVLVVAADDGVMEQTLEAINHIKLAGVAVVVAINKMDKPNATVDRVKRELAEHGIVSEDYGGDTMMVPVSAKTRLGIPELLSTILLQAEILDLKTNFEGDASGVVIESSMNKKLGPVATVFAQSGTFHVGDIVVCGKFYGKIRALINENGKNIKNATPCLPVEIVGLNGVPLAGDRCLAVPSERDALRIIDKVAELKGTDSTSPIAQLRFSDVFAKSKSNVKELLIILKTDTDGSVGAISDMINKISHPEVSVKIVHSGVGDVSYSDVMLATSSGAKILVFKAGIDVSANKILQERRVDLKTYDIIYKIDEDIRSMLSAMLSPEVNEDLVAKLEVRKIFKVTKVGIIAGCYVLSGVINKSCIIKVVRNGIKVADGKVSSLKRLQDDVKEVRAEYECGVQLDRFNNFQIGDILEAYHVSEVARVL